MALAEPYPREYPVYARINYRGRAAIRADGQLRIDLGLLSQTRWFGSSQDGTIPRNAIGRALDGLVSLLDTNSLGQESHRMMILL